MTRQSIAWVDGVWHDDAANATVSVLDHGLLYGDGVFEGIRFYAATPFLLAAHLRRLRASARCLMAERNRIIAEGAGATPVACVLGHAKSKIVCIVSGGNIDLTKLAEIFGTK